MYIENNRISMTVFKFKSELAYAQKNCGFISRECLDAFRARVLSAHNVYRLKHKVPAAKIATNTSITLIAQEYACTMISNFKFAHNSNRGRLGENLYMSMYSIPFNLNSTTNCASELFIHNILIIISFIFLNNS
jgi:hypothetical protein